MVVSEHIFFLLRYVFYHTTKKANSTSSVLKNIHASLNKYLDMSEMLEYCHRNSLCAKKTIHVIRNSFKKNSSIFISKRTDHSWIF